MTAPSDDEPLSPELRAAADAYNSPPLPRREEMWQRIQMGRGVDGQRSSVDTPVVETETRVRVLRPRPSVRLPIWLGIAAALVLAFGLGRFSSTPVTHWVAEAPSSGGAASRASTVAFRVAAVEHLGQAESFLTLFRASVRSGSQDPLAPPTARQLLATNRLILDSPASRDPKLRRLLQDLELVLAGIAQLSPGRGSEELDLINSDLERSAVLLRLRAAVPAGDRAPVRPGAL